MMRPHAWVRGVLIGGMLGFAVIGSVIGGELSFELLPTKSELAVPLISPVPDGAQWTVTPSKRLSDGALGPEGSSVIHHAYSGGVRRKKSEFRGRVEPETYFVGGCMIYRSGASQKVRVQALEGNDPDRNPGQFAELAWVSERHYVGDTEFGGRRCRVFRDFYPPIAAPVRNPIESPNPFEEEEVSGPVAGVPFADVKDFSKAKVMRTALIEADSQLPVLLEMGGRVLLYEFAPERAPFDLPPEFAIALADYKKRAVDLNQKYRVRQ